MRAQKTPRARGPPLEKREAAGAKNCAGAKSPEGREKPRGMLWAQKPELEENGPAASLLWLLQSHGIVKICFKSEALVYSPK